MPQAHRPAGRQRDLGDLRELVGNLDREVPRPDYHDALSGERLGAAVVGDVHDFAALPGLLVDPWPVRAAIAAGGRDDGAGGEHLACSQFVFLASTAARRITGTNLVVDGALTRGIQL